MYRQPDDNFRLRCGIVACLLLLYSGCGLNSSVLQTGGNGKTGVLLNLSAGAHFCDAIDSGNVWSGTVRLGMQGQLEPGSPSPFGIWGSFGTRASNDNK